MSLRESSERHLNVIYSTSSRAFGHAITITDPEGSQGTVIGLTTDISEIIDPETNAIVSGRYIEVSFRQAALIPAGFEDNIRAIKQADSEPWKFEFLDLDGVKTTTVVPLHTKPDRENGIIVIVCECIEVEV